MEKQEKYDMERLVDLAALGNRDALEELLGDVQDMVFNLSLRMLGTVPDAEDACQEILIKVMTHLSDFRKESRFSTWVFRIAVNHVLAYRKHMFSQHPLSFEYYGEDIANGREEDVPDMTGGVDRGILEEELKLSCTNVMLQCLDGESRCIFILGTMFRLDSAVAGEILGISPAAYRKRLSRIREKMAAFLGNTAVWQGKMQLQKARGLCYCQPPADTGAPGVQRYGTGRSRIAEQCRDIMEEIDGQSRIFAEMPFYRTGPEAKEFIKGLLRSDAYRTVMMS